MRKSLLTLLLIIVFMVEGHSQHNIRLTQFFQAPQFYNPAFTGIEPFTDVKVGRKQNLGAYEYAPNTSFLSINTSFNGAQTNRSQSYSLRISNPNLYRNLKNPSFSIFKHGLGAFYVNENQEAFTQQRLQVSYALHFAIKDKIRFSVGVSPYLFSNRVELDKIKFEIDPDPAYSNYSKISYNRLGVNAGALLYAKRFYLGYSIIDAYKTKPQISEKGISGSQQIEDKISHRLMGGFSVGFGKRIDVVPSLLLTITPSWPLIYNFNTKFRYNKKYWAGVSYQTTGTLSLTAGGIINKWLNVGYSYDQVISGQSSYLSGSHEIVLGIMLFNNNLNKPYFW